jgi:hypothetical protein
MMAAIGICSASLVLPDSDPAVGWYQLEQHIGYVAAGQDIWDSLRDNGGGRHQLQIPLTIGASPKFGLSIWAWANQLHYTYADRIGTIRDVWISPPDENPDPTPVGL